MLTNVPTAMAKMARNVTTLHPNTLNIQMFRKTVTRPDSDDGSEADGIRMLDTDDEESFEYEWVGNGFALPADQFQPGSMADHGDVVIGSQPVEMRFLVEPEEASEAHAEHFKPKKHDVFYVLLFEGARLAYEIVDIEAMTNIPPYAPRYVCNRRDDLHVVAG